MTQTNTPRTWARWSLWATLLIAQHALATDTDLATAPLQTSTTTQVKPNIFFIIDDSGSMNWDYLPDWARGASQPLFNNSGFNGIYYDPAITYTPPLHYDARTSYASMTSANTTRWTRVRDDGFGVQQSSTSVSNLATASTTYYTFIPGEYCSAPNLRSCATQSAASTDYPYPATLRWCTDASLTQCQATRIESGNTYLNARYPGQISAAIATLTIDTATKSKTLSSIKVNGQQVMADSASSGNNTNNAPSNLAKNIAAQISACTSRRTGNCDVAGYSATSSGNTVTITAPADAGAITYTPTVTWPTGFSGSVTAFTGGGTVPGSNELVTITSTNDSYPYPGRTSKASTRSDCAGTTCTYAEEMTNYANWWAYYRTRMQTMKTATSLAFSVLDEKFRIGYYSINNATGSDFLNIADINRDSGGQMDLWYRKLFAANPSGNTPLRPRLATAGRYYAGKLKNTTVNGSTANDPMQYACQRNYTILSTDGYWNLPNELPKQINGSANIDDQDSATTTARPFFDGNATGNTLADVALYYYNTDLRTDDLRNATGSLQTDVASNNVPDGQQRMFTSTLGLGASGVMQYQSNYATARSGDYYDVLKGTTVTSSNANNGVCSWQSSGACNWPAPVSGEQTTIDDLWHAAVNGRGSYYSAGNPAALKTGLSNFLQSVSAATGNAAAATTSNPNTVQGDNFLFQSTFRSVEWFGELARYRLDLDTGAQIPDADWSQSGTVYSNAANKTTAAPTLDNRTYTERSIYTYDGGNRIAFQWSAMSPTLQNMFKVSAISSLSQMCASGDTCLDTAAQVNSTTAGTTTGAAGINLVNFLRGDRSNEGPDKNTYYRQRTHVMGDVVDSQAVYIKKPMYNYTDSGYSTYKSNKSGRQGMVYVGANDGMLHAFNADTGAEVWSYIPSLVLPNLYKLADKNYGNNHQYYVNATPQQGDVYYDGAWHTILVGGLGRGGRGFYALDVTDPSAAPTVLWEFSVANNADVGYSFGTPVITKLSDGTWVALLTSGYNNNEASGATGAGKVWVLNAKTGAVIKEISTGEGSRATPSGLARILAYSETAATNNKATTLYGGDLLGNVWRIDISTLTSSGGSATVTKLATLQNGSRAQSITTRPQVSKIGDKRIVFVGTGRYLGVSDIANTDVQSIYAIKDLNTSFGNPRDDTCTSTVKISCFVKQVYTDSNNRRTASSSVGFDVDFDSMRGWYVDLPASGERANTDPALQLGTLVFTTNTPSDDSACSPGGTSNIIYINYKTGLNVPGETDIGGLLASNGISALASAPTLVRLPNGKVVAIVNLSNGTTVTIEVPIGSNSQKTRRVSWRELVTGQ
ncbi:pilus assembly protein [Comamonas sp. J-3]|uniref:pilus assembly protein n=1 Tax=Comamonas trifloxystrobinivorans TaxID=3350256 RepID=UPI0037270E60